MLHKLVSKRSGAAAVAVLSGSVLCKEIVIAGDCVSGVFDSRYQYQINEILDVAARINSLVRPGFRSSLRPLVHEAPAQRA